MNLPQTVLLTLLALLTGACVAGIGESCPSVGETDDCVAGAVCAPDPDPVCRPVCEFETDCEGSQDCRGVENCQLEACFVTRH